MARLGILHNSFFLQMTVLHALAFKLEARHRGFQVQGPPQRPGFYQVFQMAHGAAPGPGQPYLGRTARLSVHRASLPGAEAPLLAFGSDWWTIMTRRHRATVSPCYGAAVLRGVPAVPGRQSQ